MAKYKAHTIYRNKAGKRLPGVTTITGAELGWNTRALVGWANRIGLEGISASKYTDDKADIGTLAHAMITDKLIGKVTDTDDYSKNQIEAAQNSVRSFEAWAKGKKIEPLLVEAKLVSEDHQYGGTCDIYASVDGKLELIDLKTGKGVYDEHLIQVGGGYDMLLEEHGRLVERARILNIPRANSERFVDEPITNRYACRRIFCNCLDNYKLKKTLYEESEFYKYFKEVSDGKQKQKSV